MMNRRLETFALVCISLGALAIGTSVAHREFFSAPAPSLPSRSDPPKFLPEWRTLMNAGRLIGDSTAPVNVIEFGDFECPYCRRFEEALRAQREEHPHQISLTFIHYPLSMHRFAKPAARAAECAAKGGRFAAFHDALFLKQDSLGLKSWQSYAADAGIQDTVTFAACARRTDRMPRVDGGLALGAKLGISGTPTVIINGWQFPVTPYDSLSAVIDRIAHDKPPVGGT